MLLSSVKGKATPFVSRPKLVTGTVSRVLPVPACLSHNGHGLDYTYYLPNASTYFTTEMRQGMYVLRLPCQCWEVTAAFTYDQRTDSMPQIGSSLNALLRN